MSQPKLAVDLLKNRQALLGFVFALTRDQVLAEEIFQEVALAILNEGSAGKEVDPFMPWAREVARRRVAEFYRKTQRREQLLPLSDSMAELVALSFQENEEDPDQGTLRLKHLRGCVQKLSARAREAIEQRYRSGHEIDHIATAMSLQTDSVNVLLSKARKVLAECVRSRLSAPEAV
jgi:RNA polymerase sigma-70 factor (ECF subfamily)